MRLSHSFNSLQDCVRGYLQNYSFVGFPYLSCVDFSFLCQPPSFRHFVYSFVQYRRMLIISVFLYKLRNLLMFYFTLGIFITHILYQTYRYAICNCGTDWKEKKHTLRLVPQLSVCSHFYSRFPFCYFHNL